MNLNRKENTLSMLFQFFISLKILKKKKKNKLILKVKKTFLLI